MEVLSVVNKNIKFFSQCYENWFENFTFYFNFERFKHASRFYNKKIVEKFVLLEERHILKLQLAFSWKVY